MWCKANLVGALLTFFNYANIKGIGDAEAETLVNSGLDNIIVIAGYDVDDNFRSWESAGHTRESAERQFGTLFTICGTMNL